MSDYLTEAFQKLRLVEDDFDLSADANKIDELKSFVADDIEIPEEEVIDVEAVSEDDLEDNYNGKVILECECCHSRIYKDKDEVFIDDESNTANIDEECPVCNNTLGYSVIGKIEPYEKAKEIEVNVNDEDEVEPELESLNKTYKGGIKIKEDLEEIKDDELPDDDIEVEEGSSKKKLTEAPWVWQPDDDESEEPDSPMPEDEPEDDYEEDGAPFINGKYTPGPLTQEVIDALYDSGDWWLEKAEENTSDDDDDDDDDWSDEGWYDEGWSLEDIYDAMENSGDPESGMMVTIEEGEDAASDWLYDDEFVDTGALINTLRRYVLIGLEKKFGKKWEKILEGHPEKSWYMDYHNVPEPTVAKDRQEMIDGAKAVIKAARENGSFEESLEEGKINEGGSIWNKLVKAYPELNEEAETCPECGKSPCECEGKELTEGKFGDKIKDAAKKTMTYDRAILPIRQKMALKKNPELKESIYKDLGSGIVEEGDTITEADLKAYWDENCDIDPVLMEYDDYEAWKQDTIDNYLEEVDNFEDTGMSEKDIRDLSYDDMEKMGIYDESLNESVEVTAKGEDNVNVSKNDDGSMDINVSSTEPGEGEEIVPLDDEEITEIEGNEPEYEEEEEIETEEGEEEAEGSEEETAEEGSEEEVGEFDEEEFDNMGESYMRRVYSNVKSYNTTSVADTGSELIIEGVISFKSGSQKKTTFVLKNLGANKHGKRIFEGYNKTFSNSSKAFRITGGLDKGRYYPRTFRYNYKTKTINESNKSEVFGVKGLIKAENCRKRHGR